MLHTNTEFKFYFKSHQKEAKAYDDVIIDKLKAIEKASSSTLARLFAAQKVFDLERVREESFGECDIIAEELKDNHRSAAKENSAQVKALKMSQVELIKSCVLFKDGGNYSRPELDMYRARARKLEIKLSRFEFIQNAELEKTLPEKLELVEETKRKWLIIYDDHLRDVTMLVNLAKIKRESHVFISCELSRMQKDINDTKAELIELEKQIEHYWIDKSTPASVLHERLGLFRERLRKVVDSVKHPDSAKLQKDQALKALKSSLSFETQGLTLPDDFYLKWLLDGQAKKIDEKPLTRRLSSVRMNKRQSTVNIGLAPVNLSGTKRKTSNKPVPTPRLTVFDPKYAEQVTKTPSLGKDDNKSSDKTDESVTNFNQMAQQVIRRKLLDLKSEVKQHIFGFHQKPKPVDFPTIVTALIFDRVTKLIDAYEGKKFNFTTCKLLPKITFRIL